MRFILAVLIAAPAAAFAQQDCSKAPEQYRAMCEQSLKNAMDKKASTEKLQAACQGKTGAEYQSCLAQQNKQNATGMDAGAQAREACRSKFKVDDHSGFEACMRAEMAKQGKTQR